MKTEQITYEIFLQAVTKMQKQGEKLTLRNVTAQVGGSFSKISEYLKRFTQENADSLLGQQRDISESLRQAVFSEVGRAVGEVKLVLESQVNQLTAQLDENNEQIKTQEQNITRFNEENKNLHDQMLIAQQDIAYRVRENESLVHQLAQLQKEKNVAVTESEKYKLQLERADQDVMDMKVQIKDLFIKIESLTQAKFDAEKKAAVFEAKCEQFNKQKKT